MSRAGDLLEEVIAVTQGLANGGYDDVARRAGRLVGALEGQRGKFFYKTLTGVPNANRCKKAAEAAAAAVRSRDASALASAMSKLEAEVQEMISRADAPGTVLT
ncbi:MAG: hypothetical protein FJ313_01400 [Gemmatimonadetes bacterium]|nr:hypothetical protein [Gemmatimonadota bacterium]